MTFCIIRLILRRRWGWGMGGGEVIRGADWYHYPPTFILTKNLQDFIFWDHTSHAPVPSKPTKSSQIVGMLFIFPIHGETPCGIAEALSRQKLDIGLFNILHIWYSIGNAVKWTLVWRRFGRVILIPTYIGQILASWCDAIGQIQYLVDVVALY